MTPKEPTLKHVLEQLARIEAKMNDLAEKVRHIIHRLPDEFTSEGCSDNHSDDKSDHAFDSFPDSDDD